jgi:hypothetical protein
MIPPLLNESLMQSKKHFGKSHDTPGAEYFSERATQSCKD